MRTFTIFIWLCCLSIRAEQQIRIEFINITTNNITVESIAGLPARAAPGLVVPDKEGEHVKKSIVTFKETVPLAAKLKIAWQEMGAKHEAEFSRDQWELPKQIKNGNLQFVYYGKDLWQIISYKDEDLEAAKKRAKEMPDVGFQWFNLSTNEIWVVEVLGLPFEAGGGRLRPAKTEDPLKISESHFSETVDVKSKLTIVWKDSEGKRFPPLKSPELSPPGVEHKFELKRNEFGIPAKITNGKIRFTYLGNEQWRVKFFKGNQD